jgi:tryptophan halogenase
MNKPIERITVVGGGTTGYLTVFRLAKQYPTKLITWIYPENNEPIGVGEAIIPEVSNMLLRCCGVTHKDIIKECNGTLKLGVHFVGWNTPDESFYFTFGHEPPNPRHNSASLDRIIDTGKVPADILDYTDISTHFRSTELLKCLDRIIHKFKNIKIERHAVTLEELEGTYDLLIDCTGFKRVLTQWPDNFLSIQDKIPNNQAYIYRTAYTDREKQCLPYTVASAMNYGWIFNIPLLNEIACGYVHPSKYNIMDEFIEYLKTKFGVDSIDESKIRKVPMITGRNHIHLKDNVVAVGLSSNFIEPLESTGLWMVVNALDYLTSYIDGTISEKEYNISINTEFDSLTDFIVAHYKYSKRSNEYWDHYKNISITRNPISMFPDSGWDSILSGFFPEVKRPKEPLDPKELINIHKGKKYYEWIRDV